MCNAMKRVAAAALIATAIILKSFDVSTAQAGASGPQVICADWWIAASDLQRETFVRASSNAYQDGRNDAYYAVLTRLNNFAASNTSAAERPVLVRAVDDVRGAVPLLLFPKPAAFYVREISRFYELAPKPIHSTRPAIVLLCLANGLDADRLRMCRPIRAVLAHKG
jgi:hypothetical protein